MAVSSPQHGEHTAFLSGFPPWRTSWLRHFIGSLGTSKKKHQPFSMAQPIKTARYRQGQSEYPSAKSRRNGRDSRYETRKPPSGRRCPQIPSASTSLTRTTGRPEKKRIECSPHMEQQHGLLVVDKPRGLSSAQCTNRFKRLGQKKIGHAGTLDPMAQGVLLVLLGHATKISGYLMGLSGLGRLQIRGTPKAGLPPKCRGIM